MGSMTKSNATERPFRTMPVAAPSHENDVVAQVAYADGFFTAEECTALIALGRASQEFEGQTGGAVGKTDTARESKVRFVWPGEDSEWVFAKLEYAIAQFNRNYRFDLGGFHQGIQIAEYRPGGHYDWHTDVGPGNSNRKLSLSIQLSDKRDYDGGELEFLSATDEVAPRDIGSLIVFPSFLAHRVRPVTRGVRLSAVSWVSGPPFR